MFDFIFIIIGLIFLFIGGDWLVRCSVIIAEKMNFSRLLISTLIIGFGTSTPELLVSINAALEDFPEIALGNVIGSNISNIFLVLGIASLINNIPCFTYPIKRDAIIGVLASFLLALLSLLGYLHRITGVVMFLSLIAYLFYIIKNENKKDNVKKIEFQIKKNINNKSLLYTLLMSLISLILLILGARLLIYGAVSIANYFLISKTVVGLSLVAVGTSLPELVTVWIASWRKHHDIVIGNILGSNLFNILSILGITSFIKPIKFTSQIAHQDVWIMLASSILLTFIIFFRKKISRLEGSIFLFLYISYIFWLYH